MSDTLPNGISREEAIDGLRETLKLAENFERISTPNFVRWPDMCALIDHVEKFGFPPPN
jgi:hypothetical protein